MMPSVSARQTAPARPPFTSRSRLRRRSAGTVGIAGAKLETPRRARVDGFHCVGDPRRVVVHTQTPHRASAAPPDV